MSQACRFASRWRLILAIFFCLFPKVLLSIADFEHLNGITIAMVLPVIAQASLRGSR
jgi:hypothetical protein